MSRRASSGRRIGASLASLGSACNDPKGTLATVLSLIPPFTPMLMVLRMATPGGVPAWQPWVGLAGVLIFAVIAVWAGGRIFRVGLIMQGTPPKFSNIVRWAIRG